MNAQKEKFYLDAIHDLCQQVILNERPTKTDSEKIQYVETIREIPQENSYFQEYSCYKKRYEAIINSTSWKLTRPLRKGMDMLKETVGSKANETYEIDKMAQTSNDKIDFHPNSSEKPWIGVHMHLYYEDLLEEFCGYLNHITEPFDLYISCKEGIDQKRVLEQTSQIRHVQKVVIRETINRGRDIARFYVFFARN